MLSNGERILTIS